MNPNETGVRKMRDDMNLIEVATRSDPRATLILIAAQFDERQERFLMEIAASSPVDAFDRRALLRMLTEAYIYIAKAPTNTE